MDTPSNLRLKKVNWQDFETGGSGGRQQVRFVLKQKPDRRDNNEEIRASNAISKRIQAQAKNNELFERLPADQQAKILQALQG